MWLAQGRRFAKWDAGAEPVKTARSTTIILQFNDFSSDLTHFLAHVKDFRPFLTQVAGLKPPQLNTKLHPWAGFSGDFGTASTRERLSFH